jgi:hypothetical protein
LSQPGRKIALAGKAKQFAIDSQIIWSTRLLAQRLRSPNPSGVMVFARPANRSLPRETAKFSEFMQADNEDNGKALKSLGLAK